MKIEISTQIQLELLDSTHLSELRQLVQANYDHLKPWLPWVKNIYEPHFFERFVDSALKRHEDGLEYGFVIKEKNQIIGRAGIYKIDTMNHQAELGYWISKSHEGKGIISLACAFLIKFCFEDLALHRVQIRCAVENKRSNRLPLLLNFTHEGTLRGAEKHENEYLDLHIYSLLHDEYSNRNR